LDNTQVPVKVGNISPHIKEEAAVIFEWKSA
jgi:hypothetical protein